MWCVKRVSCFNSISASFNDNSAYCSDSSKMLMVCVGFSKSIVFLENWALVRHWKWRVYNLAIHWLDLMLIWKFLVIIHSYASHSILYMLHPFNQVIELLHANLVNEFDSRKWKPIYTSFRNLFMIQFSLICFNLQFSINNANANAIPLFYRHETLNCCPNQSGLLWRFAGLVGKKSMRELLLSLVSEY